MNAAKQQLIAILQNLSSCIDTSASVLRRSYFEPEISREHANELVNAKYMVDEWARAISYPTTNQEEIECTQKM